MIMTNEGYAIATHIDHAIINPFIHSHSYKWLIKPHSIKESSLLFFNAESSHDIRDKSQLLVRTLLPHYARRPFVKFAKDLREFVVGEERLKQALQHDVDKPLVELLMLEHAEDEHYAS